MFELFWLVFKAWTKEVFWIFLGCASSGFKKANLVSMSNAATENDKNVSTKIKAATFENNLGREDISCVKEFGGVMAFLMQGS